MKPNNINFEIESRILFEDNHLIVINKKSGELSQGDKTNDITLPDLIKSYLKKNTKSQEMYF